MLCLLLVLCLSCSCSRGSSDCFTRTHTVCTGNSTYNTIYDVRVEVIPEADTEFFQHVASLTCYHEATNTSYCWEETTSQSVCSGLPCSAVNLSLIREGNYIPSELLGNILMREDTRLALLLSGYTLQQVATGGVVSSDVPIASWVCLCVGVVLAGVVLLKPLWWDLCHKPKNMAF
ncbi:uncharacterized protein LOC135349116 [Halichondria panicea]|uniref:uncharacterized protein LOC135349116 n=1 Tax=Halichondria panicea TaxID=6063 RepID=UPI00312B75F3